ncbi:MAG: monofunctional biosynthetic peptidoglycan transglycosylase [Prevotella sp.]|nr:monofunctional biosynthetic peptidoglycan transglycosylase [Prevotella sp.]
MIVKLIYKILKWVVVAFFVTTILSVFFYRYVPVFITPLMIIRTAEQIGDGKDIKLKHNWVYLDEMPVNMVKAVIASEDAHFLEHDGFDFDAIKKAVEHNKNKKKNKHGASTISQQTAKNVFLWPSRSWVRKGLEAYFTVLIEMMWSKQRIVEVYLNSIEMGDGIYGIGAASKRYYRCAPSELSRLQCALITATLPNPRKYKVIAPSAYVSKRQQRILREMKFVKIDDKWLIGK